jgi:hypothetical protein
MHMHTPLPPEIDPDAPPPPTTDPDPADDPDNAPPTGPAGDPPIKPPPVRAARSELGSKIGGGRSRAATGSPSSSKSPHQN